MSPVPDALQQLAPADLRRIVATYRDVLRAHQDELNRLNVYPVPDGDTGTNMALTVESVVGELDTAGSTPATATARAAWSRRRSRPWSRSARPSATAR